MNKKRNNKLYNACLGKTRVMIFTMMLIATVIPAAVPPASADIGGPDFFGYMWMDNQLPTPQIVYNWVEINSTGVDSGVVGDDSFGGPFPIGFSFDFYGNTYTDLYFSTNGLITFGSGSSSLSNTFIPSGSLPHNFISPFWDDLAVGPGYNLGAIYYETQGPAPNRQFIVEWCNITTLGGAGPLNFEVILNETGEMWMQYRTLGSAGSGSATIGIEDSSGSDGLEYSYNLPGAIFDNLAIMYYSPPYSVSVSPDPSFGYGDLLTTVSHTLTISNDGSSNDTYDLACSGNSWTTGIYDATGTFLISSLSVPTGSAGDILVNVSIPGGLNYGDFDLAQLTVTSQNDTGVYYSVFVNTTFYTMPTNIAIFKNADPWNLNSIQQICTLYGIPFTEYTSADIGIVDLSPYDKVIIPSDQPQSFYDVFEANLAWFENYVNTGGILQFSAGANGWNSGNLNNLPGGYTKVYATSNSVTVDLPGHHFVSIPNAITDSELDSWSSSTHAYFSGVPPNSVVIASDSNGPCLVESVSGLGRYFAYGLIAEWGWGQGYSTILENIILSMYGWAAFPDYALNLTPQFQTSYGSPAGNVDYTLTITNMGKNNDTYDLSYSGVWPVTFRDEGDTMDITTLFVESGNTSDFIARVNIPGGALPGDLDLSDITATSQGDTNETGSAQLSSQVPYLTGWMDGFESGLNSWRVEVNTQSSPFPTTWEAGDPSGSGPGSAYNGTGCAGTNLWSDYYPDADIVLISPYVQLGAAPMILSFYNWYEMDTFGDDGGFIEISASDGPWNQIWPVAGYPFIGGYLGGYNTDGYSGTESIWTPDRYDLSPYSNQVVRVRFHLAASAWEGWQWGWYVDDVYMGAPPPYEMVLLPDVDRNYNNAGGTIDYILNVDNIGTSDDTYDLAVSGNLWPVTFRDISDTIDIISLALNAGTNQDFIVRVSTPGGASPGDIDWPTINCSSQNDSSVWDESTIMTQVPYTTTWFDGFESGWGGWMYDEYAPSTPWITNWEMGDPLGTGPSTAYDGANCAGTNIIDDYYPGADLGLVTPYIELGPAPLEFTFQTWYEMNTGGDDGGFVEISVDNGAWNQIWPVNGYPFLGGNFGGYFTDGYSGASSGWEQDLYDISAYAGSVVRMRFHFATTTWWGWQWGWYLDDIYIGPPPLFRLELTPDYNTSFGSAGSTVDYTLSIKNTGSSNDTYDLSYSGAWPMVFRDIGDTTDITSLYVASGSQGYFIARVNIPGGANPGDLDLADINASSQGDPLTWIIAQVDTRVSLSPPWFEDFESGVFGGSTGLNWSTTNPSRSGVGTFTAQSGLYSMHTLGGIVTITSIPIDLSGLPSAEFRCWVQRGSDTFSEDPDTGENLVIEYLDVNGSWNQLVTYLGSGTPAEVYTPIFSLPADALHSQFRIRFRQTGGSGGGMDYWHIDDVYVGAPLGDVTPPEDVIDLFVSSTTSSTATLTWTAPGDDGGAGTAAGYEVRYSTVGIINAGNWGSATSFVQSWIPLSGGSTETHDVTGLGSSTQYWFAMITRDEVPNYSGISNSPTGTTLAPSDVTPPEDIMDLFVSSTTSTTATLTWTAPGDDGGSGTATAYDLRYSTLGIINAGNWGSATVFVQSWTPLSGGSTENHDVTGLSSSTQYWFAIITRDEVPNYSGVSNSPTGTTLAPSDLVPPADILDLTVWNITTNTVTLRWTATGDDDTVGTATIYEIRYSTTGPINNGNWGLATVFIQSWIPQLSGSTEQYDITGLSPGIQYWFAIRAADEEPNWNNASNSPSATTLSGDVTPPSIISDLTAILLSGNTITLNWTAPGDDGMVGTATAYEVRYSTVGLINDGNWASATVYTQSWVPQIPGNTESYDITGLASGTQYWFAIRTSDEVPNRAACSNSPSEWTDIDNLGPDILDVRVNGATTVTVSSGTIVTLSAVIDDQVKGDSAIGGANYTRAEANWPGVPMNPLDGSFDSSSEFATITISTSGWSDGIHRLYVYGWDGLGNSELASPPFAQVRIDNNPPSSYVYEIDPFWHQSGPITISATASDSASDVDNVQLYYSFSVDEDSWSTWYLFGTDNNEPWEWQFDFPEGEGYYRFRTESEDDLGNTESASGFDAECGYDGSPPASVMTPLDHYWFVAPQISITTTASDDLNTITEVELFYRYSQDNISWSSWRSLGSDTMVPWSWQLDLPDGEGYYEFYTIASDGVDNPETKVSAEIICAYDSTDPIADAGVDMDVTVGNTVTFDATGSSDNVGVRSYEWTFSDGPDQTLTGLNPTYIFENPGSYLVTLTVTDYAGSQSESTIWVNVSRADTPNLGTISGKVRDENGHPLKGARVTIPGSPYLATTDEQGYYSLKDIPQGNYDVIVSHKGYEKRTLSGVHVAQGQETMDTDFTLPKSAAQPEPSVGDFWWIFALVAAIVAILLVFILAKRKKSDESHDQTHQNYFGLHTLEHEIQHAEGQPQMPPQQVPGYTAYTPPPPEHPPVAAPGEEVDKLEGSDSKE